MTGGRGGRTGEESSRSAVADRPGTVWGVLRQPRWLLYLLLAVVFGVITFNLGLWQLHRYEGKVDRRELVETNYFTDPRPLVEVLPSGEPLTGSAEWTHVTARGTYAAEGQLLVRNRPQQRVYGYEVLVPLVLEDGRVLMVDRGWVRNARTAAELPDVPPPPRGQVEVTGWLRPSEPDLGRDLPEGQLASIDLPRAADALGEAVVPAYLILGSETPAPAETPALLEPPDTRLGSHFAYALQWWLTVPVGLILVVVMARREAQEGAEARGEAPARKARRKKVRIWDEEDA